MKLIKTLIYIGRHRVNALTKITQLVSWHADRKDQP